MRAHTSTAQARVGARGRTKGSILALSLAVALLAATASTASAATSLNGDYDFGDQQVGTTSPAQRFILLVTSGNTLSPRVSVSGDYAQTNDCPPTLSDPPGMAAAGCTISVSGDYAQTNDCPPTLSDPPGVAAAGCTISVTFTPTAFGPRTGTLSAGPGGPTAALTGNGCSPPGHCPLTFFLDYYSRAAEVKKKLKFVATTANDSTLVARGDTIKKTTKRLAAGEQTTIKAKLKHPSRFRACAYGPPGNPVGNCFGDRSDSRAKIKVKATDEFGQTATNGLEFRFYQCFGTC